MNDNKPIQLCEWGHMEVDSLDADQREAIELAASRWQAENRLPASPLYFAGAGGRTLRARQYVGVVEAAGCTVEIYPKLDARLLRTGDETKSIESPELLATLPNVMRSLLWMLDAAGIVDAPDADTAALDEVPTDFIDVFAYLLAKNLRAELAHGVARRYETEEGNVSAIRGRLQIATQVCRNAARMDYLACKWDEFSPNTPENRLFRCACRHLVPRVRHAETLYLLQECLMLLDEVENVSPQSALYAVRHMRRQQWNRNTARFQRPFELAHRLLSGFGHALESADADTFVFLLDMNKVFEGFVGAALAARFKANIETQKHIGHLLHDADRGKAGRILQKPDFYWKENSGMNRVWIGDAKYKLLGRAAPHLAATFSGSVIDDSAGYEADFETTVSAKASKAAISPDDIRQLTVYAELDARKQKTWPKDNRANLAIFYPVVGYSETVFRMDRTIAWNDSPFFLVPVRVNQTTNLADALPTEESWREPAKTMLR